MLLSLSSNDNLATEEELNLCLSPSPRIWSPVRAPARVTMAIWAFLAALRAACCAGLFSAPTRWRTPTKTPTHHRSAQRGGRWILPAPPNLKGWGGGCNDHFSFRWRFARGLYNDFRNVFCKVFLQHLYKVFCKVFLQHAYKVCRAVFYNIFARYFARLLQHFYKGALRGFYSIFTRCFARCFLQHVYKVFCKAFATFLQGVLQGVFTLGLQSVLPGF